MKTEEEIIKQKQELDEKFMQTKEVNYLIASYWLNWVLKKN